MSRMLLLLLVLVQFTLNGCQHNQNQRHRFQTAPNLLTLQTRRTTSPLKPDRFRSRSPMHKRSETPSRARFVRQPSRRQTSASASASAPRALFNLATDKPMMNRANRRPSASWELSTQHIDERHKRSLEIRWNRGRTTARLAQFAQPAKAQLQSWPTPAQRIILPCDEIRAFNVGTRCEINGVRYSVLDQIGTGSHGKVYKASRYSSNVTVGETVAIKAFRSRQIFEMESRLLHGLRGVHGIIPFIDASIPSEQSSIFLIVMKYIPNGDLQRFLHKNKEKFITSDSIWEFVRTMLLDISYALQHLSENFSMFHADIKPENILVDYSNSTSQFQFYLTDMSCSMKITEFESGRGGGTQIWMSPEMLRSVYLREYGQLPTKRCIAIDAYPLELVAVAMYGTLCDSRRTRENFFDFLCINLKAFELIDRAAEEKYDNGTGPVSILNHAIHARDTVVSELLAESPFVPRYPPALMIINRQLSFLHLLSMHIIREPDTDPARYDQKWIRSRPNRCVTWPEWREAAYEI